MPNAAGHVEAGRVSVRQWHLAPWWPAIVIALLVVLQCTLALPRLDDTLLHEDSGHYLVLARSLASGRGYLQLSAPGDPAHVLFPPAFPAALAGLQLAGARSAAAAKVLVLLFGVIVIPATYALLRPRVGNAIALLIAAWVAVHPDYLRSATTLCADAPYLALSLVALLAVRASGRRHGWRDAAGFVAWAATVAAALTRAVGLPLIAVAVPYLAWRKAAPRWGARLTAFALLSVVYLGPAVAWEAYKATHASDEIGGYAKLLQLRNEYDWDAGTVTGVSDVAERFARNTRRHVRGLGGVIAGVGTDRQRTMLGFVALGLIAAGMALEIRRGRYLIEAYLVLAAIATVSHPAPQLPRYLLPMLPFVLFYPATLAARRGVRGRRLTCAALAGCIVAAVATHDVEGHEATLRPGYDDYRASAEWLAASAPPDAVVLCRKPALMYWWSGRKSVPFPLSRNPKLMDERVARHHVTYVVEDAFSDRTPLFLGPWLSARGNDRTLVHTQGATRVWRLAANRAA
jgi:hypothetical protein